MAQRGIEPPSAEAIIAAGRFRPPPADVLELSVEDLADTVGVVCFVDTMPWTHERPLFQGEKTEVPRKVAQRMAAHHQVTILE